LTAPELALVTPVPSAPIPDFVDLALHFPELVSPSSWLLWALDQVCGCDPVEWVTEKFSGDWERMSTASSALDHLARYHEQFGAEIDRAVASFERGWEGEASAAAARYFRALAQAVEAQSDPLRSIAQEVNNVAQGMRSFQELLVSLIGAVLDWAIAIAVSAAATAASSWTVVGGLIGGGATAVSIAGAVKTWLEVIEIHAKAMTMVDAFVGLTAGYLGSIHGFAMQPLPGGAYNNTEVG